LRRFRLSLLCFFVRTFASDACRFHGDHAGAGYPLPHQDVWVSPCSRIGRICASESGWLKLRRISADMQEVKGAAIRVFACLALFACCAGLCFAQRSDDASTPSKILALERIWRVKSYGNKDLNALDVILDPGFINVDQQGRVLSKAELLARLQASQSLTCRIDRMDVRVHGNTAIVTAIYTSKRVVLGQLIVHHGRFVDTWLRSNRRWSVLASLSVPAD
jgi:hypothetical protein